MIAMIRRDGMKATSVRLPHNIGKWITEQAEQERRALFGQVLYALDLVLEDWEWVLAQDIERQRQIWKNVIETSENEVNSPDSSNDEDIPVSVRIPLKTFNQIVKLALFYRRSINEQIVYMLNLAVLDWRTLQERRLQRSTDSTEKKTSEKSVTVGAIFVAT
jgi:hypothetical protein